MGSLVKRLLAPLLGCGADPRRLYHATVMPCYDKKLEAVREELTLPDGVPEVRRGARGPPKTPTPPLSKQSESAQISATVMMLASLGQIH